MVLWTQGRQHSRLLNLLDKSRAKLMRNNLESLALARRAFFLHGVARVQNVSNVQRSEEYGQWYCGKHDLSVVPRQHTHTHTHTHKHTHTHTHTHTHARARTPWRRQNAQCSSSRSTCVRSHHIVGALGPRAAARGAHDLFRALHFDRCPQVEISQRHLDVQVQRRSFLLLRPSSPTPKEFLRRVGTQQRRRRGGA
jgi:hypothetical protein